MGTGERRAMRWSTPKLTAETVLGVADIDRKQASNALPVGGDARAAGHAALLGSDVRVGDQRMARCSAWSPSRAWSSPAKAAEIGGRDLDSNADISGRRAG